MPMDRPIGARWSEYLTREVFWSIVTSNSLMSQCRAILYFGNFLQEAMKWARIPNFKLQASNPKDISSK